MKPTPGDVHVNRLLTNLSINYLQAPDSFVADRVFPSIPVEKQSDLYLIYDRADFFRDDAQLRAPSTESAGGGYSISNDSYLCRVYAFHKDIDDETRQNTDNPASPDADATKFVTDKMKIKREKLWVENYFTSGVWTFDYDGVAATPGTNEVYQWDNYTSSDPIADIDDAMTAILEATGYEPNTMVIGYRVFKALKNHPDIIDRVKYVQNIGANDTVKISASALTSLFFDGVPGARVVVMKAIENTSKEGQTSAAADNTFIGGRKALLCYSAPSPSINQPSAGYTFTWSGLFGANAGGMRIRKFREEKIKSDRIEAEMAFDHKKIAADLGFFWDSIVSTPT